MNGTVTIKKVVLGVNMSAVHKLRHRYSKGLNGNQTVLLFNKRDTIARLVDNQGNLYSFWSDKGKKFNTSTIIKLAHNGLKVKLNRSTKVATVVKIRRRTSKKAA